MKTLFEIMKKLRFFLAGAAIIFGVIGMGMNYDLAYILCLIFIVLAIASDVVVLVLHKKLGIPVKYHENMFNLKKRK